MTEREKLEQALAFFADRPAWPGPDNLTPVLLAAQKYLDTLPKPVWRVTGSLQGSQGAIAATPHETSNHEEALDFARSYLAVGYFAISVTQV